MKKINEILKLKRFVYGSVLVIISLIALVITFSSKRSVEEEFAKLQKENVCFQGDKPDPEWNNLSPDERKSRTNRCMAALNKMSQVKFGPYIFSFSLFVGMILLLSSFITIRSSADKAIEEWENENDNKLS